MRQFLFLISFISLLHSISHAQTIGGNSTYNFLKLPNTPQLTALGGINISNQNTDASLAFNNPALLRDSMSSQLTAVFNSFYAGIKNYHAFIAQHSNKLDANFALGINFFNYGNTQQTDAAGNVIGNFHPVDYVVQFSAEKQYEEQWYYGLAVKYISSSYAQYKSSAIAADFGVTYTDEKNALQIGFVAKNMGVQLKTYSGQKEDLPFDVQLGISKKLLHAPIQFSLTAQHIHQLDIRYDDTTFNNEINSDRHTTNKIIQHLIAAVQVYFGNKIEFTAGYNFLRRSELNITTAGNGLNGLSVGLGATFSKLQVRYARAYYQNNTAYNQLGINIKLDDYFDFFK